MFWYDPALSVQTVLKTENHRTPHILLENITTTLESSVIGRYYTVSIKQLNRILPEGLFQGVYCIHSIIMEQIYKILGDKFFDKMIV
jgi:hypothetical protein